MKEFIKFVKLVAVKEGLYSMYVFKDLDTSKYIMCTKLPNWNMPNIAIGEEGFIKYQEVMAGQEYYNPSSEQTEKYKYSNLYLISYINKSEISGSNIIL